MKKYQSISFYLILVAAFTFFVTNVIFAQTDNSSKQGSNQDSSTFVNSGLCKDAKINGAGYICTSGRNPFLQRPYLYDFNFDNCDNGYVWVIRGAVAISSMGQSITGLDPNQQVVFTSQRERILITWPYSPYTSFGSVSVTARNCGFIGACGTKGASLNVMIDGGDASAPHYYLSGDATVQCGINSTVSYQFQPFLPDSYRKILWNYPEGWTEISRYDNKIVLATNGKVGGSVNLIVQRDLIINEDAGCMSAASKEVKAVKANVGLYIPETVCAGKTTAFAVTNLLGVLYDWSLPTGFTAIGYNTNSNVINVQVAANAPNGIVSVNIRPNNSADNCYNHSLSGAITVKYDCGLDDLRVIGDLEDKTLIYPNPSKEKVTVKLPELPTEAYKIELLNATQNSVLLIETNTQETDLNLSNIREGLYIVAITYKGMVIRKKLSVQK